MENAMFEELSLDECEAVAGGFSLDYFVLAAVLEALRRMSFEEAILKDSEPGLRNFGG